MVDFSRDGRRALSRYFSDIRAYRLLTPDQERDLSDNVRKSGCEKSVRELVEANLSFVVKVASEYRNLGLAFEDLLNEGNLGLIRAAHRYDATKGTRFITYAVWWIRKSILKALTEHSRLVRVPSYQMKRVREIQEAEELLSRVLGRKPSREEISLRLHRRLSVVDRILQFKVHKMSLEDKPKDSDRPISDYLVDSGSKNPEEDLIHQESSGLVTWALRHLPAQQRKIISYRFGIGPHPVLTLKQLGEMLNLSRERVRQIECKAIARLRKLLAGRRNVRRTSGRPHDPRIRPRKARGRSGVALRGGVRRRRA